MSVRVRVTRTAQASWHGDLDEGGGRIGLGNGAYEGPFTLRARVDDVERSTNPEELIGAARAGCFTMSLSARPSVFHTDDEVIYVLDGEGPPSRGRRDHAPDGRVHH